MQIKGSLILFCIAATSAVAYAEESAPAARAKLFSERDVLADAASLHQQQPQPKEKVQQQQQQPQVHYVHTSSPHVTLHIVTSPSPAPAAVAPAAAEAAKSSNSTKKPGLVALLKGGFKVKGGAKGVLRRTLYAAGSGAAALAAYKAYNGVPLGDAVWAAPEELTLLYLTNRQLIGTDDASAEARWELDHFLSSRLHRTLPRIRRLAADGATRDDLSAALYLLREVIAPLESVDFAGRLRHLDSFGPEILAELYGLAARCNAGLSRNAAAQIAQRTADTQLAYAEGRKAQE